MKHIVYLTTNKVNGKIYIGIHQTEDPDKWDYYLGCGLYANKPSSYKNPHTPFQYAVNKYGPKNFERKILYVYDTREKAANKEAELVDKDFVRQENNYNVALGGGNINIPSLPVYQFDKNGNLIKYWEYSTDALEFYGLFKSSISNAVQMKESLRGFYWARTDTIDVQEYSKGNEKIPIYQYSKNGKLLHVFESLTDAGKYNGYDENKISTAIRFQQLVNGQWYFSKTLYDEFKIQPRKSLRGSKFYLYNENGEFIQKFENAEALQQYFQLKSWAVLSKAIHYNNGIYKNWQIFTEYKEQVEAITPKIQSKPVIAYTKSGEFVGEFKSEHEAAKTLNCRMSQINRVLRGVAKTTNGYVFKWKVNDIV